MRFQFEERASDSPLVAQIWRTHSEAAGIFLSQAVSHWELVVWRHGGRTKVALRGPETYASIADCPPDSEFLGIQFRLGVFMPHLPADRLRLIEAKPIPSGVVLMRYVPEQPA